MCVYSIFFPHESDFVHWAVAAYFCESCKTINQWRLQRVQPEQKSSTSSWSVRIYFIHSNVWGIRARLAKRRVQQWCTLLLLLTSLLMLMLLLLLFTSVQQTAARMRVESSQWNTFFVCISFIGGGWTDTTCCSVQFLCLMTNLSTKPANYHAN